MSDAQRKAANDWYDDTLYSRLNDKELRVARGYKPEHDKVMRLNAQTATIENGFVLVPREAAWLADYLHELTTFPNAKYDY